MTQFRVLPVQRGDAFLLQGGRGAYLFDGGSCGSGLREMLRERKVRKLRAAVCTFPDLDRLGGILDLMESDMRVSEFWLPGELHSLCRAVLNFDSAQSDWIGLWGWRSPSPIPVPLLFSDARHRGWLGCAARLLCLGLAALTGTPVPETIATPHETARHILSLLITRSVRRWQEGETDSLDMRSTILRAMAASAPDRSLLLCGRLLLAESSRLPTGEERTILTNLALGGMTAALVDRRVDQVRFLHATNQLEEYFIPRHPLCCLNGVERSPLPERTPVSAQELAHSAQHLSTKREGLVFQYGNIECGVLLCGRTTLGFLGKSRNLVLSRPTVVAAPDQGGVDGSRAMGHIHSRAPENDYWVRAHTNYARKIATPFKEHPNRHCLNHCVNRTMREILLSFEDGRWHCLSDAPCLCR